MFVYSIIIDLCLYILIAVSCVTCMYVGAADTACMYYDHHLFTYSCFGVSCPDALCNRSHDFSIGEGWSLMWTLTAYSTWESTLPILYWYDCLHCAMCNRGSTIGTQKPLHTHVPHALHASKACYRLPDVFHSEINWECVAYIVYMDLQQYRCWSLPPFRGQDHVLVYI